MPDTSVNDFFETLVAAANIASAAPKYTNAMIDAVYTGFEPEYNKAVGESLTVIIPTVDTSLVTNIGNGAISV